MRRFTAGGVVAAVVVVGTTVVTVPTATAAAPPPYELTSGHIDLFQVSYDEESAGLDLQVKDDTGLYDDGAVVRDPADVVVAIDPAEAALEIPAGLPPSYDFLGEPGETVYVLPQNRDDDLPWPGWSTEPLVPSLPDGVEVSADPDAVSLDVEVAGPGDLHTYMNSATGGVINHYVDSSDGGPDTIPVSRSAHVHTEWAFTETGTYTLTVTPSARTTSGAVLTGAAEQYVMRVGDADPDPLGLTVTPNKPDAKWLYGQGITLTAAPTEPTDLDHYHWFIKPAGADEFQISNRSATAELKLPTSLTWDGAQVYASLYDDDHQVVASSEPMTLDVTALEPITTLTSTSDQQSYRPGDVATFTATQDPATAVDHYHWYVRKTGEEFYTYIPGSDAAEATLTVTPDMDGASVVARLFDDAHAVVAESAPLVLDVAGAAATSTTVALTRPRQEHGTRRPTVARVTVAAGEAAGVGTVTVRAGRRVVADGAALNGSGAAAVRLPRDLRPGRHPVVATFEPGSAGQSGSSSAPVALVVTKGSTRTHAVLAKRTVRPGERARLTVTVASGLPVRGKIVVRDGRRTLRSVSLDRRGKAVVRLPRLSVGRHRLVVTYRGTELFSASSARRTLRVVR